MSLDDAKMKGALHFEDMSALKGFKIGLDADLLLSRATDFDPAQSLQEGNTCLDSRLYQNLCETLTTLRQEFKLEIVVVLSGLRMPLSPDE